MIEAIGPLAIEGVNSALPYLAKSALVVGEEVGMAYEAVQGIVATNPESAGIMLEVAASFIPGPELMYNYLQSLKTEVAKNVFFIFSNLDEITQAGKETLDAAGTLYRDIFPLKSNNFEVPLLPNDNTRMNKPNTNVQVKKPFDLRINTHKENQCNFNRTNYK